MSKLKFLKQKSAMVPRQQPESNEYDQETPQSHTADQPTARRGGATEHLK